MWAGVCKKCQWYVIAGSLFTLKKEFRTHFSECHNQRPTLPEDMSVMNKSKEIDLSPNESGWMWASKQFENKDLWIAVITWSDYSTLELIMDNENWGDAREYLNTVYY